MHTSKLNLQLIPDQYRAYSSLTHKGPSIKYVTLFLANFDPSPPVTLCHTSRDTPRKYVTHLGPPRFLVVLVQRTRTKAPCTNSINRSQGFLSGGFCPGVFCLKGFVVGGFCSDTCGQGVGKGSFFADVPYGRPLTMIALRAYETRQPLLEAVQRSATCIRRIKQGRPVRALGDA